MSSHWLVSSQCQCHAIFHLKTHQNKANLTHCVDLRNHCANLHHIHFTHSDSEFNSMRRIGIDDRIHASMMLATRWCHPQSHWPSQCADSVSNVWIKGNHGRQHCTRVWQWLTDTPSQRHSTPISSHILSRRVHPMLHSSPSVSANCIHLWLKRALQTNNPKIQQCKHAFIQITVNTKLLSSHSIPSLVIPHLISHSNIQLHQIHESINQVCIQLANRLGWFTALLFWFHVSFVIFYDKTLENMRKRKQKGIFVTQKYASRKQNWSTFDSRVGLCFVCRWSKSTFQVFSR